MIDKKWQNKICCGIVLYNPDIERLRENIGAIASQISKIIIVDNCSSNWIEIQKLLNSVKCTVNETDLNLAQPTIQLIRNNENKGIAYALNQLNHAAKKMNCSWILTLDQDSVAQKTLVEHYVTYIKENPEKRIGQLCCNIVDRNVGNLDKKTFENTEIDTSSSKHNVTKVEHCITSGAFSNVNATIECGGYDEKLFIDAVDEDLSFRLGEYGYQIFRLNVNGLLHELGKGEYRRILGRKVLVSNHLPWRNYYARRNHIYLARKYYEGRKKVSVILRETVYACGSVLMEDQKPERFKQNFKGIVEGFKMDVHGLSNENVLY